MPGRRLVSLLPTVMGIGLIVALALACSGNNEQRPDRGGRFGNVEGDTTSRDPAEDGRRCPQHEDYLEESLDTSGDNVSDVRKVYRVEGDGNDRRKVLVCRELDLNHDGRKDVFRFYTEEGRPMRELTDGDFDGRIDTVSYFENGRIVKQEADRNNDGRADETRHLVRGKIIRVDRDDNHDGEIDVWEHWDEGRLLRIGYDLNRDKVADLWHRAPPREQEEEEDEGADDEASEGDDGDSDDES